MAQAGLGIAPAALGMFFAQEPLMPEIADFLSDYTVLELARTSKVGACFFSRKDAGLVHFSTDGSAGLWKHFNLTNLAALLKDLQTIRICSDYVLIDDVVDVKSFCKHVLNFAAQTQNREICVSNFVFSPCDIRQLFSGPPTTLCIRSWCASQAPILLKHDFRIVECRVEGLHFHGELHPSLTIRAHSDDGNLEFEICGTSPLAPSMYLRCSNDGVHEDYTMNDEGSLLRQLVLKSLPCPILLGFTYAESTEYLAMARLKC